MGHIGVIEDLRSYSKCVNNRRVIDGGWVGVWPQGFYCLVLLLVGLLDFILHTFIL